MKEYIAHRGSSFVIEWFYGINGRSQVLEYFNGLDEDTQDSLVNLFVFMGETGKLLNKTKFRNEGDGIYAFKCKFHRFLSFFFVGKKIVLTNAFAKKQDKLPANEKKKALRYKLDYETRVKRRVYYV
ncbi:MAG: type II toxin-antitoxin system RelE/ParE family toxin [Candidatus Babeliales bacterium]|jgi:hypothetical protein